MSFVRSLLTASLVVTFLAEFYVVADVVVVPCPTNCTCSCRSLAQLTVDCRTWLGIIRPDPDHLYEQIDLLLALNVNNSLDSLWIQNSPLSHVPRSVCRLTTLKSVNLQHNRLTVLPMNCFTNLSNLTKLDASYNNITYIPDGIFDGMRKLFHLSLARNSIYSIGTEVFSSKANLSSLRVVDLRNNTLTNLEPWWYDVGLKGSRENKVQIDVSFNNISRFTNKMRWRFHCGMPATFAKVDFSYNPINHFSDVMDGWQIPSKMDYICLITNHKFRTNVWFVLTRVYLICDCRDFFYFSIAASFAYFHHFDNACCRNTPESPSDIIYSRITSVPLDKFVCILTKGCPSGCRCVYRPANVTLHVHCSNTNLIDLPLELPELPNSYTKYKLDFSNNRLLRRLEHRDYFVNTSILDVSNCGVETLDDVWSQLVTIRTVFVNGNRLTQLPVSAFYGSITCQQLNLGDNPWKCSCEHQWLTNWLRSIKDIIINPAAVMCQSPDRLHGKNLFEISNVEFCVDPNEGIKRAVAISVASLAGLVVVLSSVGVIIYRLRAKLYTRWKFHPFDRDECLGEDMDYDVFLCCSSDDHDPQGRRIVDLVEENGYRVCYHYRDFLPGTRITDNIEESVTRSKRTLCLLTTNFVRSGFCMYEFEVALNHWISKKRTRRLIVLMALDSPTDLYANDASDTAALRQHLSQYTYIDYTADDWLDKLLYALPIHGMNNQHANDNDNEQLIMHPTNNLAPHT